MRYSGRLEKLLSTLRNPPLKHEVPAAADRFRGVNLRFSFPSQAKANLRVSSSRYRENQSHKSFRLCKRETALRDELPTQRLASSFPRPRRKIHNRRSDLRGHCPTGVAL